MSVSAFPNTATVGQTYLKYFKHVPSYDEITIDSKYEDGGKDYNTSADTPPQRWTLEYDGLTEAQAKVLDDHYASALGTVLGFSFTEPRNVPWTTTGSTYTDVHYENYTKNHTQVGIQSREIVLIKRPS